METVWYGFFTMSTKDADKIKKGEAATKRPPQLQMKANMQPPTCSAYCSGSFRNGALNRSADETNVLIKLILRMR